MTKIEVGMRVRVVSVGEEDMCDESPSGYYFTQGSEGVVKKLIYGSNVIDIEFDRGDFFVMRSGATTWSALASQVEVVNA